MLASSIIKRAKVFGRGQLSTKALPIVNSHNEFDLLEEVIVGKVEGATIPEWHVSGKAVWPEKWWDMYKTQSGQSFPPEMINKGACFLGYYCSTFDLVSYEHI